MSAVMYIIFPSAFHLFFRSIRLLLRETPQTSGSACAGGTTALCQFSSIRPTSRFHAKSNQVAQIVKGTVDVLRSCQAGN